VGLAPPAPRQGEGGESGRRCVSGGAPRRGRIAHGEGRMSA
jgi:hypothetical protein